MHSPPDATGPGTYAHLRGRAAAVGLAVRGAFNPRPHEFEHLMPGSQAGTIVLLGFTGATQWDTFRESAEFGDGSQDALDRWSRRVISALAAETGGRAVYPSGEGPTLPFQRLALRCEPVFQSPVGLLIHERWGLWHAYRGALVLAEKLMVPVPRKSTSPCMTCIGRLCVASCPVGAHRSGAYDITACVSHLASAAGANCAAQGCLARRACPVGATYRYRDEQMSFHMAAFLRAVAPSCHEPR